MRAAKVDNSERLQRVLKLLKDGREHSTLDIIQAGNVCAVNSIISELRANGYQISCSRRGDAWYYRMDTDKQEHAA
ncbi:hypothetical protein [Pseudohongiella spirulinae]|uniref:Uncharacterized protein n=1 Tax=Pseudohongiella spirulinae TaxID=1249552 RepID=A0A0S2KF64_9GAMM|nr:hypothetical protein [Pseudohongiella spirulinae]ALO46607.1 hypothetical protein PS2015_1965 [Pseudohongiella spirulinae]